VMTWSISSREAIGQLLGAFGVVQFKEGIVVLNKPQLGWL